MAYTLNRRRKPPIPPPPPEGPSKVTPKFLEKMRKDVMDGTVPVSKKSPWISLPDDRQVGLRIIIRKSGAVTFHIMYNIGDSRPMMIIGQWPDTKIEEARHLGKVVRSLADRGIDVQSGLHERLLRELAEQGENWRPDRKDTKKR